MKTLPERNMKHMNMIERSKHLQEWSNFRQEAMAEAENLYGTMNSDNLKSFQSYMKKEEKKWRSGLR